MEAKGDNNADVQDISIVLQNEFSIKANMVRFVEGINATSVQIGKELVKITVCTILMT